MDPFYEYEPTKPSGFIIFRVEPSLIKEAGPTRTSVGYAPSEAEVLHYYPAAKPGWWKFQALTRKDVYGSEVYRVEGRRGRQRVLGRPHYDTLDVAQNVAASLNRSEYVPFAGDDWMWSEEEVDAKR